MLKTRNIQCKNTKPQLKKWLKLEVCFVVFCFIFNLFILPYSYATGKKKTPTSKVPTLTAFSGFPQAEKKKEVAPKREELQAKDQSNPVPRRKVVLPGTKSDKKAPKPGTVPTAITRNRVRPTNRAPSPIRQYTSPSSPDRVLRGAPRLNQGFVRLSQQRTSQPIEQIKRKTPINKEILNQPNYKSEYKWTSALNPSFAKLVNLNPNMPSTINLAFKQLANVNISKKALNNPVFIKLTNLNINVNANADFTAAINPAFKQLANLNMSDALSPRFTRLASLKPNLAGAHNPEFAKLAKVDISGTIKPAFKQLAKVNLSSAINPTVVKSANFNTDMAITTSPELTRLSSALALKSFTITPNLISKSMINITNYAFTKLSPGAIQVYPKLNESLTEITASKFIKPAILPVKLSNIRLALKENTEAAGLNIEPQNLQINAFSPGVNPSRVEISEILQKHLFSPQYQE
ncbi:MAG: hypothetical protein ACTSR2_08790 [Candidatus Hodarchaeales archaeon]